LCFDAEGRVEFAAEVFQRDRGCQFDDLRLAVMLFQLGDSASSTLWPVIVMRSA
jgi:hypothetical protein